MSIIKICPTSTTVKDVPSGEGLNPVRKHKILQNFPYVNMVFAKRKTYLN